MKFEALIYHEEMKVVAEERFNRDVLEAVFHEHRARLITTYCSLIRFAYEVRRRNAAFPKEKPIYHMAGLPSPEWCNAAIHILVIAEQAVQRFFLAADAEKKDELVQAVLTDGGVRTGTGYFSELPPL
jgi:hypothetical protein